MKAGTVVIDLAENVDHYLLILANEERVLGLEIGSPSIVSVERAITFHLLNPSLKFKNLTGHTLSPCFISLPQINRINQLYKDFLLELKNNSELIQMANL